MSDKDLIEAARYGLRAVDMELMSLQAKMSTLSGEGLKVYEDSFVYKRLVSMRERFSAALKEVE